VLRIPLHATVQNCARLGGVVPELDELLAAGRVSQGDDVLDKTAFSMLAAPGLLERLGGSGGQGQERGQKKRWTVALLGVEAHVCISQTALALQRAGHDAYVLADGVGSANRGEVHVALDRLAAQGWRRWSSEDDNNDNKGSITVTSSEAFLFEVMRDAAVPEFRDVLRIVKDAAADTAAAMAMLEGGRN